MTLLLSRLVLDPRSRNVRRDLADCHTLHQRVMTAFPTAPGPNDRARETFGVLYRLDARPLVQRPTLLVQSAAPPDWSHLPDGYLDSTAGLDGIDNPAVKSLDRPLAILSTGDHLAFRLRANPTKRLSGSHASDNRLAGKRVALLKEHEQLAWLARKARDGGFAVLTVRAETSDLLAADTAVPAQIPAVRAMPAPDQIGRRPRPESGDGSQRLTFGAVVFEGLLRVLDANRFRLTLAAGIGSGKAYGFGLLSIAPAGAGR